MWRMPHELWYACIIVTLKCALSARYALMMACVGASLINSYERSYYGAKA